MYWGAEYRHTNCVVCGKSFMDDCGESFCSGVCERQYEYEHATCEKCGNEVGQSNLNNDDICENCEEEEE